MKPERGISYYSHDIKGERGNYEWSARFDFTDGYVGINQDGNETQRVLLSPKQVKALIAFINNPVGLQKRWSCLTSLH